MPQMFAPEVRSDFHRIEPITLWARKLEPAKVTEDDRGELRWIPLDQLYIDPSYQRPILAAGRKNIQWIVENFDWALFGTVTVRRRNEKRYAVIDGQHRAIAARTHGGIAEVPCLVVPGDLRTEARAFAAVNSKVTAVNPLQLYASAVVAGDKEALEVKRVADAAGVEICRYPVPAGAMKVGQTLAVGRIKACVARFGAEVTAMALRTVTKTGDGNRGFLKDPIIAGTCQILSKRPALCADEPDLLKKVRKASVPEMFKRAMQSRIMSEQGGAVAQWYALEFEKAVR